jgi:hypothetical protein
MIHPGVVSPVVAEKDISIQTPKADFENKSHTSIPHIDMYEVFPAKPSDQDEKQRQINEEKKISHVGTTTPVCVGRKDRIF